MQNNLIDELPPVQRLALAYGPARTRMALLPLLALDVRLAAIVRKRREVVLVQVRLAWWRDLLAQPVAQWPRGDAVLDALAGWHDPAALVPLVDGWEALLADDLSPGMIAQFTDGRAQAFAALAREVDASDPAQAALAGQAGQTWALADLAANLSDGAERQQVLDHARTLPRPPRLPALLRPLAVLAALGHRALGQGGGPLLSGPKSAWLALRTGFFGR